MSEIGILSVGLLSVEVTKRRGSFRVVVEVSERSRLDRGEGGLRGLRGGLCGTKACTSAREHRVVILQVGYHTRVIWPIPDGRLEDDALVIAFALAFRLDAVGTGRSFLAALDPPFAASQAPSLCPLSRFCVGCGGRACW